MSSWPCSALRLLPWIWLILLGSFLGLTAVGIPNWAMTNLMRTVFALLTFVYCFVVARTGTVAGYGELCIAVCSLVATTQGSRVAESFAQRPPTKPVD